MTEVTDRLESLLRDLSARTTRETAEGNPVQTTTYTLYDESGALPALTEQEVYDQAARAGLVEKAAEKGLDNAAIFELVHSTSIRFVRLMLMLNEAIHTLTIHGEVWVTHLTTDPEGKPIEGGEPRRYEAMHYLASARTGETVIATQSIIRPSGEPVRLDDDFKIQDGFDESKGELMQMFPVQRSDHSRRVDVEMMRQINRIREEAKNREGG